MEGTFHSSPGELVLEVVGDHLRVVYCGGHVSRSQFQWGAVLKTDLESKAEAVTDVMSRIPIGSPRSSVLL